MDNRTKTLIENELYKLVTSLYEAELDEKENSKMLEGFIKRFTKTYGTKQDETIKYLSEVVNINLKRNPKHGRQILNGLENVSKMNSDVQEFE